VEELNADMI
jgi:hypothetical protein